MKPLTLSFIMTVLIHFAVFLMIPTLPLYLKGTYHLTLAQISHLLTVEFIAYLIGSICFSILGEILSNRKLILVGALLQAGTTLLFTFISQYIWFFILVFIYGFGHGINNPGIKTVIACYGQDDQTMAFSKRGMMANLGIFLSGLYLLLLKNDKANFLTAAFVYCIIASFAIYLPKSKSKKQSQLKFKTLLQNKSFYILSLIIILVNFAYCQLQFLLPLKAEAELQQSNKLGIIWMFISLEVVILQSLITKWILKRIKPLNTLILSLWFFALGILLLGMAKSFPLFLFSAGMHTIGQMLMVPMVDRLVGATAKGHFESSYFGLANMLMGIGSAFGTYSSGFFFKKYGINESLMPWLVVISIILSFSFIIYYIKRKWNEEEYLL